MNRTRSHILALDQGRLVRERLFLTRLAKRWRRGSSHKLTQDPAGNRFIDPGKTRLYPASTSTPLSQIALPAKPSRPKTSLRFTRAKAFVNKSQNSKPYT